MSDTLAWTATLALLVALLALLPLVPALREWQRGRTEPLHIPSDDDAGIDFFARRMRERLATDMGPGDAPGRAATLPQGYVAAPVAIPVAGSHGRASRPAPSMLGERIELAPRTRYFGDIHARAGLRTGGECVLRAALVDGRAELGEGTTILRWLDAEEVHAGRGCRLFGRVSARRVIVLGPGALFNRMAAPEIRFGHGAAVEPDVSARQRIHDLELAVGRRFDETISEQGRWVCRGDLDIPANTAVTGHLIVEGLLNIEPGCIVSGSIKCYRQATIGAGSQVLGSLFAGSRVALGESVYVAGMVSAEAEIECAPGVRIGGPDMPASVLAPAIRMGAGCVVYGSIWASNRGMVAT